MQLRKKETIIPVFSLFAFKSCDISSLDLQAENFILKNDYYRYTGVLVPEANMTYLNPWFFASLIIKNSARLTPFIAVNPIYTHPFFTAKYIANLSLYLNKPLYINYITGTALFDGKSLGDSQMHDSRYERLGEYCTIISNLLTGSAPYSFNGQFYTLDRVTLPQPLGADLLPVNYIAGKSDSSLQLIKKINSRRLSMAIPLTEFSRNNDYPTGFHFGIIARPEKKEAFEELQKFSPFDNHARRIKEFATRQSEAEWKKELMRRAKTTVPDDVFNLGPFSNGHSDVPYLVGCIEDVAQYIYSYLKNGLNTLVIEIPNTGSDEFCFINNVFLTIQKLLDLEL